MKKKYQGLPKARRQLLA